MSARRYACDRCDSHRLLFKYPCARLHHRRLLSARRLPASETLLLVILPMSEGSMGSAMREYVPHIEWRAGEKGHRRDRSSYRRPKTPLIPSYFRRAVSKEQPRTSCTATPCANPALTPALRPALASEEVHSRHSAVRGALHGRSQPVAGTTEGHPRE